MKPPVSEIGSGTNGLPSSLMFRLDLHSDPSTYVFCVVDFFQYWWSSP